MITYNEFVTQSDPLAHLVDARGLAEHLGVDRNTINVWRSRARAGKPSPLTGIEPVGELNGAIWTTEQLAMIEKAMEGRRPGRPSKTPSD